jgi:hypothetical protein
MGIVSLALLAWTGIGFAADPGRLVASDLRCEDLVDPIGIDIARPRLSWQMRLGHNGAAQTAYRIRCVTSPDLLKEGSADLWDSGKRVTAQSQHIVYTAKNSHAALPATGRCVPGTRTAKPLHGANLERGPIPI